ncbi:DUF494 family protein [Crenobacter cavernae]|uniref:Protein Smg homolog n=1 Tax=Crenobacter cavernae TaxID=2290923 RepID=A0A345Y3V8_9NEIS|nr:DUF494 domain-containing protein [Crenobacter cavernae]AXK38610.1 DUF494 domain-containing protein [Crenobacter cavernae]RXZ44585.1 DUF494 domain-containing protein [Crenobacter cavernae]
MFDVLSYLLEEYSDLETCPDRDDLSRHLVAAGFEDDEIDEALDWVEHLTSESSGVFDGANDASSMRVYSRGELEHLPTEVRGLIQFLEDNSGLTPAQRELTIDRLMALPEDDIDVDLAKLVALMVLWSQQSELPILVGEELLAAIHGEPTMQ